MPCLRVYHPSYQSQHGIFKVAITISNKPITRFTYFFSFGELSHVPASSNRHIQSDSQSPASTATADIATTPTESSAEGIRPQPRRRLLGSTRFGPGRLPMQIRTINCHTRNHVPPATSTFFASGRPSLTQLQQLLRFQPRYRFSPRLDGWSGQSPSPRDADVEAAALYCSAFSQGRRKPNL